MAIGHITITADGGTRTGSAGTVGIDDKTAAGVDSVTETSSFVSSDSVNGTTGDFGYERDEVMDLSADAPADANTETISAEAQGAGTTGTAGTEAATGTGTTGTDIASNPQTDSGTQVQTDTTTPQGTEGVKGNGTTGSGTGTSGTTGTGTGTTGTAGASARESDLDVDVSTGAAARDRAEEARQSREAEIKKSVVTTEKLNEEYRLAEEYNKAFIQDMKSKGFIDEDIQRVMNGEIDPEQLMYEIMYDKDSTRRRKMMEVSYLQGFNTGYTDIVDFRNSIALEKSDYKKYLDSVYDDNIALDIEKEILNRLKNGKNLDEALKNLKGTKWVDEYGFSHISFGDVPVNSKVVDENINVDAYIPEDFVNGLKSYLTLEMTGSAFWGTEKNVWMVSGPRQEKFNTYYNDFMKDYNEKTSERVDINNKLSAKEEEITKKIQMLAYIENEINTYIDNIDEYASKPDFYENIDYDPIMYKRAQRVPIYEPAIGDPYIKIDDKERGYDLLACIVNNKCLFIGDEITLGGKGYKLKAKDDILKHMKDWQKFITDEERSVYNYLYNTEGAEAAYNYIVEISNDLDNRCKENKEYEDRKLASEMGEEPLGKIFMTGLSVLKSPYDGIKSVYFSAKSWVLNEKIRRTDTYNPTDIWRAQIAQDIYEDWRTINVNSKAYDMAGKVFSGAYGISASMLDTALLMGASRLALSGFKAAAVKAGTITVEELASIAKGAEVSAEAVAAFEKISSQTKLTSAILSAVLMGSKSYSSTLNDCLDRGMDDNRAIILAFSAGVIETAMEYMSVGHLLDLEGKTAQVIKGLMADYGGYEKVLSTTAGRWQYAIAVSLSQGFAEGLEELSTEVLNSFFDTMIAGGHFWGLEGEDYSNLTATVDYYIAQGCTGEEAIKKAAWDELDRYGEAFIGGLVSGICFGSIEADSNTRAILRNFSRQLAQVTLINEFGGMDALIESGISKETLDNYIEMRTKEIESMMMNAKKSASQESADEALQEVKNNAVEQINGDIEIEIDQEQEQEQENNDRTVAIKDTADDSIKLFDWSNLKTDVAHPEIIADLINNTHNEQEFLAYLWGKVLGPDVTTPPAGFESVEEYRQAVFKAYDEAGVLDLINDRAYTYFVLNTQTAGLAIDKGANRIINNFITANGSKNIAHINIFSKLSTESVIKLLSAEGAGEYLKKYSVNELLSLTNLKNLHDDSNPDICLKWLNCTGILEAINNLSDEDLVKFFNSTNAVGYKIAQYQQNESDLSGVVELYEILKNRLFGQEIFDANNSLKFIGLIKDLPNLSNSPLNPTPAILQPYVEYFSNLYSEHINEIESVIKESLGEYSVKLNPVALYIEGDFKSNSYYDIKYKIDGVEYTETILEDKGVLRIGTDALKLISQASIDGNLEIVGLELNEKLSEFVVTRENGLDLGVNEIVFEVNGETYKFIRVLDSYHVNDVLNYLNKFNGIDVNDVKLISVTNRGEMKYEVSKPNQKYKVSYEIDGKKETIYIDSSSEGVIDLSWYVKENGIFDITNIEIGEEVSLEEVKEKFPQLRNTEIGEKVFTDERYGGHQANVMWDVRSYISGTHTGNDVRGELLSGLIDKYFPNITDTEKINLAEHFSPSGCSYISYANAFVCYILQFDNAEAIFKERTGIDLVDANGDYNIEALAFDIYLSYISENDGSNIDEILSKRAGTGFDDIESIFVSYFKNRGINLEYNCLSADKSVDRIQSHISDILNSGNQFAIISAEKFDLKILSQTEAASKVIGDAALADQDPNSKIKEGVGGHGMLVTGIDEDGNLIVSTWSTEAEYDANNISDSKGFRSDVITISFELDNNFNSVERTANLISPIEVIKNIFSSNTFSTIESTITPQQQKIVDSINKQIEKNGNYVLAIKNTSDLTSAMLKEINDLSKLSVQILGPYVDSKGKLNEKYHDPTYIDRFTYSGYEVLDIVSKIEQLSSKVDKSLPVVERAHQIYEIIAQNIPVMRDYEAYEQGHRTAASLRGITENNAVGKMGLVCAGYAALFKEMCDRFGINCEYIRGRAFVDLTTGRKSEKHAWNVIIDELNNIIPVDVCWRSSMGKEWFGRSTDFQESRVADPDEKYREYGPVDNNPENRKQYFNILDSVVQTTDAKTGDGLGRLLEVILTGNYDSITRTNNCRENIKKVPLDVLVEYAKKRMNPTIIDMLCIMAADSKKYGMEHTLRGLNKYLDTNDPRAITSDRDARNIMLKMSKTDIKAFLEQFKKLDMIKETMIEKYGEKAILNFDTFLTTGDLKLITSTNNARNIAASINETIRMGYLLLIRGE